MGSTPILLFKCRTSVLVGSTPIPHFKCSMGVLVGSMPILHLKCSTSVLVKSITVLHLKCSMNVLVGSMPVLHLKLSMRVLDSEYVYNNYRIIMHTFIQGHAIFEFFLPHTVDGSRTLYIQLASPTPYPLGYACQCPHSCQNVYLNHSVKYTHT